MFFRITENTDSGVEYKSFSILDIKLMSFRKNFIGRIDETGGVRVVHHELIAKRDIITRGLQSMHVKRFERDLATSDRFLDVSI